MINVVPLLWGIAAPLVLGLVLGCPRICRSDDIRAHPLVKPKILSLARLLLKYPPAGSHLVTFAPVVCCFLALATEWLGREAGTANTAVGIPEAGGGRHPGWLNHDHQCPGLLSRLSAA